MAQKVSTTSIDVEALAHGTYEVDAGSAAQDMSAWHDCTASGEPFRWSRIIERGSLAVQLHVPWVYTWTVDPWVVEVRLAGLDQHDLEVMVQVGQTASHHATGRSLASPYPPAGKYQPTRMIHHLQ